VASGGRIRLGRSATDRPTATTAPQECAATQNRPLANYARERSQQRSGISESHLGRSPSRIGSETRPDSLKSGAKWGSSCAVTFRSQRGNAAFSARPQFRNACFVTFACRPMPLVVWSDRRRLDVLPISAWARPTRQRLTAQCCASCRPPQPLGCAPQRRVEKGRFGNPVRSGCTSPISCSEWHA
jgi:hypothetical protein